MKLLRAAAEAEVRATAYRIITQRPGTDELMVQLVPILRQLLNEGAVHLNLYREKCDRITVDVREWGDDG